MTVFEMIGVVGFISYISTYALLQTDKLDSSGLLYTCANLFSASLVLVSLTGNFNLASALIQISWIMISFIGLWRIAGKRSGASHYQRRKNTLYEHRLDYNLG